VSDSTFIALFVVGSIAFFGTLMGGIIWVQSAKCEAQWERSGLKSEIEIKP
jgi:hypothetical protein